MIVKGIRKRIYRIINLITMKKKQINIGKNFEMWGVVRFYPAKKQSIVIGDGFKANSGMRHNPIGGDSFCILRTLGKGRIQIGNNVGISNCAIVSSDSIDIGNHVMIGGSVKIYDTDFHWLNYYKRISESGSKTKPIKIKDGAFIGAHSIILKGVTIGEKSIIGAGSVVTKDIPDGEIWAGNPAKLIRKNNELENFDIKFLE